METINNNAQEINKTLAKLPEIAKLNNASQMGYELGVFHIELVTQLNQLIEVAKLNNKKNTDEQID